MNKARELASSIYLKKHGKPMPRNDVLEVVFDVLDAFNGQHWHDRNRYNTRIMKLEKASDPE